MDDAFYTCKAILEPIGPEDPDHGTNPIYHVAKLLKGPIIIHLVVDLPNPVGMSLFDIAGIVVPDTTR